MFLKSIRYPPLSPMLVHATPVGQPQQAGFEVNGAGNDLAVDNASCHTQSGLAHDLSCFGLCETKAASFTIHELLRGRVMGLTEIGGSARATGWLWRRTTSLRSRPR